MSNVFKLLKQHYSTVLLFFILSYLVLEPFAEKAPMAYGIFYLQYVLILILGPYLMTLNKYVLGVSAVIVGLSVMFCFATDHYLITRINVIGPYIIVFLIFFVSGFIFWETLSDQSLSMHCIISCICIYLLIAIFFSNIYLILAITSPGTFAMPNPPNATFFQTQTNMLYYSFTTITTLGYGDIHPVSAFAKRLSSIEACTGILFIGLFIAKLIGKSTHECLRTLTGRTKH